LLHQYYLNISLKNLRFSILAIAVSSPHRSLLSTAWCRHFTYGRSPPQRKSYGFPCAITGHYRATNRSFTLDITGKSKSRPPPPAAARNSLDGSSDRSDEHRNYIVRDATTTDSPSSRLLGEVGPFISVFKLYLFYKIISISTNTREWTSNINAPVLEKWTIILRIHQERCGGRWQYHCSNMLLWFCMRIKNQFTSSKLLSTTVLQHLQRKLIFYLTYYQTFTFI